jgi:geranylgeranyl diphosphate synthase, type II
MTFDELVETESQLHKLSLRVEQDLHRWLPSEQTHPRELHQAMRYSVLSGGKRIRPALMYATGQALDIAFTGLDGPACAVELIHVYSLIHDDLPSMDDDDLRRGKPTCHKAFGEATAILAGDAIQALSFYILAHDKRMTNSTETRIRMIETLAQAAGSRGMAGGQAIDLASVGKILNLAELEDMHIHKTGALIRASILLAALCKPDLPTEHRERLDHYAKCIGLAFQIRDDVLDVEGDTKTLGKPQGSDSELNKPTYPSLLGLEEAKIRALTLHDDAINSLAAFGERADMLRNIATYIVKRVN